MRFPSPPALPPSLDRAVARFPDTDARLAIWQRVPHITPADYAATDGYECEQVSHAFAALLTHSGIDAVVVTARDAEVPLADLHIWVRTPLHDGMLNIDWTARQFHNLAHPPHPAHQDLPFPLLWMTGHDLPADTHPVVGRYRAITETIFHAGTRSARNTRHRRPQWTGILV